MSLFKSELFLIIVAIVIFGIFVLFATGVMDPLMAKIGTGMTSMVDSVFSKIPTSSK